MTRQAKKSSKVTDTEDKPGRTVNFSQLFRIHSLTGCWRRLPQNFRPRRPWHLFRIFPQSPDLAIPFLNDLLRWFGLGIWLRGYERGGARPQLTQVHLDPAAVIGTTASAPISTVCLKL